jgi:hypothetical protein
MARLVPDSMARYATHELSELLRQLTPQQREAIGRIVQHHYIDNRPLAQLFTGDAAVCSENTYYKRGSADETGEVRRQGWSHQPAFVEALEMAARLALQAEQGEEMQKLRKARARALNHAEAAVNTWIDVMQASPNDSARNEAAKRVLELAYKGTEEETPAVGVTISVNWDAQTDDPH